MTEPTYVPSLEALNTLTATNKYLILDFTAQWCPPCKAIAPLFTKLATQHTIADKLAFAKVDVDEAQDIAKQFGITAMPTFLFLVDGSPMGNAEVRASVAPAGVKVDEGEQVQIRGANPRSLVGAVEAVAALAKAEAEAEAVAADRACVGGDADHVV
ncbi:thioredoxin-like protein [Chaetomidium leptoderma]|uniref:Thioredoxin-like protein n=1 Tax=Chaetomidium leptoderma TaxID=669021 RepID=A0AAN6VHT2_9PEZI|nr:thioredoxin-like protein [Chaetomidium leptoderma]